MLSRLISVERCPICGSNNFVTRHSSRKIRREIELRSIFVANHLDHKPGKAELMDLTEFMHGGPGRLLECRSCGLVIRDEARHADYANDVYDSDLLHHLYPRYVRAFQEKEAAYRALLPATADVIELGSHLGAFLEVAERWKWRPTGLDIGKCTSAFARSKGFRVRRETIEDTRVRSHSADALFIWNCFEQIEDPGSALRSARGLLKRHGILVVRVPNVGFYERRSSVRGLACSNLLGFPYRFGYHPRALIRLLAQHNFEPVAEHRSSLLTIPFPELPPKLERESRQDSVGSWIEVVCRKIG